MYYCPRRYQAYEEIGGGCTPSDPDDWIEGKELEKEVEARFPLYIVDGVFQEDNESTDDDHWTNRKGVLPSLEITAYDVLEALLWADVVHCGPLEYYAEHDELIRSLDEIVEAIAEHNQNPSRQWFDPASLCRFYLNDLENRGEWESLLRVSDEVNCPEGTRREVWKGKEPEIDAQDYLKHLIQELKLNY